MAVRDLSAELSAALTPIIQAFQAFAANVKAFGPELSERLSRELSERGMELPHSEETKYVVYVLWVRGHSLSRIARLTGLRVKQLAGLVDRSPFPNRSAMTDQQRQAALDELWAIRVVNGVSLDHGKLDSIDWKVLPLLEDQRNG